MGCVTSSSGETRNERFRCNHCKGERETGLCTCRNTVGTCSCPPGAAQSPDCVFYSPRIRELAEGQKTEFETTQTHWTVVDLGSAAEAARVAEDNRKYFDEVLVKHPKWGAFFTRFEDLKVGKKIGEGGQAEIFAASSPSFQYSGSLGLVAKVWKEGVSLRDLERQWPPQMLSKVAQGNDDWPFRNIYGGAFMRDGELKNRFAFVMQRRSGDLRSWMDEKMLEMVHSNHHGPPFINIEALYDLIWGASIDLQNMHEAGVLHRDIKASNVLLNPPPPRGSVTSIVIDYECSVGVTGTGFWRAPEILEQLKRGVRGHRVVFTEKADIYSFGMLCYEMITGRIPFEGHPQSDYSIVSRGERPQLPHNLPRGLKQLVLDCWQHDPQHRPTLREVSDRVHNFRSK